MKKGDSSEDISIVMAVYNHEDTLVEALESALMQEMPYSSMIYCLDDASTDGSGAILQKYAKMYPDRIKVFTSPKNLGSGKKSFFYHRPAIKGRYWCLLAGDDYWTKRDKLLKQVAFLDENRDYTGCGCGTLVKDEVNKQDSIIQPSKSEFNLLDLLLMKGKYAFYVHTSSIIWRNVYLNKGFFLPKAFGEEYAFGDVMLMHMMLTKGGKFKSLPEIMSCYRVTGRGIWTGKSSKEKEDLTAKLERGISTLLPWKYRLLSFLWEWEKCPGIIKERLPRPINE